MRNKLILFGMILLIFGCNTAQRDDRTTDDEILEPVVDSESSVVNESLEAIWAYDYNTESEEFEVKQMRSVDKETLTGETVEKIINKSWPGVQIIFTGVSNDTAFVSIPDSKVLTQQMGSAGAESFMVSTTFSFTELKGISCVSFDFEEGDHGIPGVYNRKSWDANKNQ